jgi:hypothetical protein
MMIPALLVSYFLRELDYEVSGEEQIESLGQGFGSREIFRSLIVTKGFWRYIALVMCAVGIRVAYRSLDATLPKYMERTIGEGSYYGLIMMLNPLSVIIFTPIFTPLAYYFKPYTLIIFGGAISAGSCFIMLAHTTYFTCAMFVITLGLGESIWTPRFYEYSLDISPKGKEGTYIALTSAPMFLASMIAGFLSGALLDGYCPEDGSTGNCWRVWLILGLIAVTSPVLLFIFRR